MEGIGGVTGRARQQRVQVPEYSTLAPWNATPLAALDSTARVKPAVEGQAHAVDINPCLDDLECPSCPHVCTYLSVKVHTSPVLPRSISKCPHCTKELSPVSTSVMRSEKIVVEEVLADREGRE